MNDFKKYYMELKDSKKYKYELLKDYFYKCDFLAQLPDFCHLYFVKVDSTLIVRNGYQWDGPSGPTIDDDTNIRASLIHDALYQSMRTRLIAKTFKFRRVIDKIFSAILKEDGMGFIRRTCYFYSVRGVGFIFAYFLLTVAFLTASCSVVFVYSKKEIIIKESDNIQIEQLGSELKDNQLDQKANGELKGVPGL
jgi:hypothetical protein